MAGYLDGAQIGGHGDDCVALAASCQPPARGPCLVKATMRPATNRPPPLTETEHEGQRVNADAAMLEFVKALARQQAIEDHLRDIRQDEIYDPRRDLRPL